MVGLSSMACNPKWCSENLTLFVEGGYTLYGDGNVKLNHGDQSEKQHHKTVEVMLLAISTIAIFTAKLLQGIDVDVACCEHLWNHTILHNIKLQGYQLVFSFWAGGQSHVCTIIVETQLSSFFNRLLFCHQSKSMLCASF